MGSTFSNISVLKGEAVTADSLKKQIISYMKEKGLVFSENCSGGSEKIIIRNNPESKWFTIYGNDDDYENSDKLSALLSKKLSTYSMFIVNTDSDFMIIKLSFGGKNVDTAIVGEPYDDMFGFPAEKAGGDIKAWEALAKDPAKLIGAFGKEYIFSEDVLASLGEEAGVCANDIITYPNSKNALYDTVLYMSTDAVCDSDFIIEGDTVTEPDNPSGAFCGKEINKPFRCFFINRGGISKGAAVIIAGSFLKESDTVIGEIYMQRGRNMDSEICEGDNALLYRMKTERSFSDDTGEPCITAVFPDFEFPEGFSKICKTLSEPSLQIVERRHLTEVRFFPKGSPDCDLSDMTVTLQPLSNQQGKAAASPWK